MTSIETWECRRNMTENEMFELVLDPRSPAERALTRDERLLLRSLSAAA